MQNFDTREGRHHFSVDGRTYFLPPLDFTGIEAIDVMAGLPKKEQADKMRELLASIAGSPRRIFRGDPRKAVEALPLLQVVALFNAWAGVSKKVPSGESSGSVG